LSQHVKIKNLLLLLYYYYYYKSLIALMMEAVRTSETSVNQYLTTRQYIPEDFNFYLQIDESTANTGHAHVIAVDAITNFFCKGLPERRTSDETFSVTDEYLRENGRHWQVCVSVFTHGAAPMTGNVECFKGKVRELNPEIRFDHCFNHREGLVGRNFTHRF
jgi:hypothetical protein